MKQETKLLFKTVTSITFSYTAGSIRPALNFITNPLSRANLDVGEGEPPW